ncbi:MAG: hypothetical protein GF404_04665 [candidate division Zixibacteria bacterium]|nr:hypothetical protein [candidate division Zixibacteria bacterium]
MRNRPLLRVFAILLGVLLSFSSVVARTDFSNAKLIEESELCLECHTEMGKSLEKSVHRMVTDPESKAPLALGCISCHPGWEAHLEEPSPETIVSGHELSAVEQAELCAGCHQTSHQAAIVTTDPHFRQDFGCSSCHKVHDNDIRYLVKDDSDNYCTTCHNGVALKFNRPSSHPLESGNIRCSDCHYPGEIEDPRMTAGLDWVCQDCHYEVAGPYIHEHPVVYSHLVEGSGCSECHDPHGAPNDRLLKQAGDGTCRQCHIVPAGHRTAHAGLAARNNCIDCHSQIHGSNHNPLLLDPDLGMKMPVDCYECHDFKR